MAEHDARLIYETGGDEMERMVLECMPVRGAASCEWVTGVLNGRMGGRVVIQQLKYRSIMYADRKGL